MTRTIGIYIFDGIEVLDFAGPYEVFTCASRVAALLNPGATAPFRVVTIGQSAASVRARAGLELIPEADFSNAAQPDILIVPGGVVDAELDKPAVIAWIAATAHKSELVASVCTGAFLLAQAGVIVEEEVTTHWDDIDGLQAMFPRLRVQRERRWIDHGRVVTSAGISAGTDMALHLVARLGGRELAVATARRMEYDWNEG